tara:strand:- start:24840 stop:25688 length:849 start_codon:yes stop_codon:yes gene_type:complete
MDIINCVIIGCVVAILFMIINFNIKDNDNIIIPHELEAQIIPIEKKQKEKETHKEADKKSESLVELEMFNSVDKLKEKFGLYNDTNNKKELLLEEFKLNSKFKKKINKVRKVVKQIHKQNTKDNFSNVPNPFDELSALPSFNGKETIKNRLETYIKSNLTPNDKDKIPQALIDSINNDYRLKILENANEISDFLNENAVKNHIEGNYTQICGNCPRGDYDTTIKDGQPLVDRIKNLADQANGCSEVNDIATKVGNLQKQMTHILAVNTGLPPPSEGNSGSLA